MRSNRDFRYIQHNKIQHTTYESSYYMRLGLSVSHFQFMNGEWRMVVVCALSEIILS